MSHPSEKTSASSLSSAPSSASATGHLEDELQDAVAAWDARGWPRPDVMVVAGSGLSTQLGRSIVGPTSWADLLPFPVWGIVGHPLEIELLEPIEGRTILYSRGRLHAYQGYSAAQTVFTVRLARLLGAEILVLTNSSGGLQPHHRAGELLLIKDHLNMTGMNPLWGEFPKTPAPGGWGPQFPDMMNAYDPELRARLRAVAEELEIALPEGVYAGMAGPSYETPAEVRMLRTMGGDAVGMSTVLEIIAAHHMGMRCACISVISNPGAGVTDDILDHDDVLVQGKKAGKQVARILERFLTQPDLLG